MSFVKTPRARNKIRHVINATEREKAVDLGQKLMERDARRLGVSLSRITRQQMEEVAADYGVSKIEDLYAALGWGKYSARQVLSKLAPGIVEPEAPARGSNARVQLATRPADDKDYVIQVKGIDDLLTYRAQAAATPSAASPSWATSREARAWPCTHATARTSRT